MDAPAFTLTKKDALHLFGNNGAEMARALGVTRQYVNKLDDGPLPEWMALKIRFVIKKDAFGEAPEKAA